MARKCLLYKSSTVYKRHVCIDAENAEDILAFLENPKIRRKFDYIVNRILSQNFIYYEEFENLTGYDNVSEFRIFPNGLNARIYCKEVSANNGNFYVVAAKLLAKKKSDPLNKKISSFIKPIESYIYETNQLPGAPE